MQQPSPALAVKVEAQLGPLPGTTLTRTGAVMSIFSLAVLAPEI